MDYLRYAFEARLDNIAVGCLLAITIHEGYATKLIALITAYPIYPLITFVLLVWAMFAELAVGSGFFHTAGLTINSILIAMLLIQLVVLSRGHRCGGWRRGRCDGLARYRIRYTFTICLS